MMRYRFHCTNGSECILDAEGALVRGPTALVRRARAVAEAAKRTLGTGDWADWRVSVHDLAGRRVWVEPFVTPNLSARESALAA